MAIHLYLRQRHSASAPARESRFGGIFCFLLSGMRIGGFLFYCWPPTNNMTARAGRQANQQWVSSFNFLSQARAHRMEDRWHATVSVKT